MFGNKIILISVLIWDFIKGILVFSSFEEY